MTDLQNLIKQSTNDSTDDSKSLLHKWWLVIAGCLFGKVTFKFGQKTFLIRLGDLAIWHVSLSYAIKISHKPSHFWDNGLNLVAQPYISQWIPSVCSQGKSHLKLKLNLPCFSGNMYIQRQYQQCNTLAPFRKLNSLYIVFAAVCSQIVS